MPATLPVPLPSTHHPRRFSSAGRWAILSDIHIPYHDRTAVEIAVRHVRREKVSGVLLNGDIVDAPGLSQYLKEPSVLQIKREVQQLRQFFGWLQEQLPESRIVWKLGNHEARLYAYLLSNAPALFGLDSLTWAAISGADDYGVEVMEDDTQHVLLGKLPVFHGHEFGRHSIAPPANPARGLYLKAKCSALCGHHHVTNINSERDAKDKEIVTWTTGALCHLKPRYARFNRWNHGFAIIEVYAGGGYDVHNLRIFEGRVS